jgi:hypothetical protein
MLVEITLFLSLQQNCKFYDRHGSPRIAAYKSIAQPETIENSELNRKNDDASFRTQYPTASSVHAPYHPTQTHFMCAFLRSDNMTMKKWDNFKRKTSQQTS